MAAGTHTLDGDTVQKWARQYRYTRAESVALLCSGTEYFDNLRDVIAAAQCTLLMDVYTLAPDNTGKAVIQWLSDAAQRGVQVYLTVDAYGSNALTTALKDKIRASRIHFREFAPLLAGQKLQPARRLHEKVVVADNATVLLGGINVSDRYHGTDSKLPWLDYAIKIVGGELPKAIHEASQKRWRSQGHAETQLVQKLEGTGPLVRAVRNDWLLGRAEISKSYRVAIGRSEKEIIILASYFLPGLRIRRLLSKATKRGISVRLIIGRESDVPVVKRAINYLYGWLLRNNIEVYEYQPSMVHGKVMVVDGRWCTIGSYNLNHLSDYASLEQNVNVLDPDFATTMKAELEERIDTDCREILPEQYYRKKLFTGKLLDWMSYYSLRFLLKVLLWLTQRGRIG